METGTHDDPGGNSLNIQELQNFANIYQQKSGIPCVGLDLKSGV